MKNLIAIIVIAISFITTGCSKESLEKIDLEEFKNQAVEKKEDIKNIKEKIKKIKKKL